MQTAAPYPTILDPCPLSLGYKLALLPIGCARSGAQIGGLNFNDIKIEDSSAYYNPLT